MVVRAFIKSIYLAQRTASPIASKAWLSGAVQHSPPSNSGSGLAAAAHKPRQNTNDSVTQIPPITSSVVVMLAKGSIGRACKHLMVLTTNADALIQLVGESVSYIFTPAPQDWAHAIFDVLNRSPFAVETPA